MQAVSREQRARSPQSAAEKKRIWRAGPAFSVAGAEDQNPTSGSEEKREAISAPGNVVDSRAVDGMHSPEERGKERQAGNKTEFLFKPFWFQRRAQNALEKEKQRDRASGMEEQIGEVKTERVRMPEKVIGDE